MRQEYAPREPSTETSAEVTGDGVRSSRDQLKRSLAGLTYQEQLERVRPSVPLQAAEASGGSPAVAVQKQEAPEGGPAQAPAKDKPAEGAPAEQPAEDYIALLGEKLGPKAYELIMKHLGHDWLVQQANDVLKKGSVSLEGLKDEIGLDDESNAALAKFGDELIAEALKAAVKWLAGESGKAFVGKLQGWARENPEWVVALAILGVAGYVTHTLYSGKLAVAVGLSPGLRAKFEAKYGSFDVFALQSIGATLTYEASKIKVEVEGGYNAEKETGSGKASVTLGEGDKSVTGSAGLDEEGAFRLNLASRYGDEARGLLGTGAYKDGAGLIGLGTYLRYGQTSAEMFPGYVGDRPATVYRLSLSDGPLSASVEAKDADLDQKIDEAAAELKVSRGQLMQMVFKLGYSGGALKGEAQARLKHGAWAVEALASADLGKAELEKLVVKLGFKGEDTLRQFSVQFARKVTDQGTTDDVAALFDIGIGNFVVRGQGQASFLEGSGVTAAGAGVYVAAPITSTIKGIAGLKVDYDFLKDQATVMPGVGVQLFGAPLMFHTDFQDKFLFSIGIKF
jgi:hypothetical protein